MKNWCMGSRIDKCVMRVPFILSMPNTDGHLLGKLEVHPTPKVPWVEIINKRSEDLFYKTGTGRESELNDFDSYLGSLRKAIKPYLGQFTVPKNYEIVFESSDELQVKIEALLSFTDDSDKLLKFVEILKLLEAAVKEKRKLLITEHVLQNLHEMVLHLLTESKKFGFVDFAAHVLVKAVEEHFDQEWPSRVAKSQDSEILLEFFSIAKAMLKLSMCIRFGKVRNLGRECQHVSA